MSKCPKCHKGTLFDNHDPEGEWESTECPDCGWMVN